MPSTPPKRQPRLKESCDRCSIAKVRCNKDKPSCSRCAQKGMSCGYSYSRRAGRRTTSNLASMAAILERHDSTSSGHMSHSPSLASISPHLSASPGGLSDDSDIFPDMWSFPPTTQPNQIPNSNPQQQFGWHNELYNLSNPVFNESFGFPAPAPGDQSLMAPLDALDGMDTSLMPAFSTLPQPAFAPEPATPLSSIMHRSSTSTTYSDNSEGSSQPDTVQDDLANLTDLAEAIEKKFDAVVRHRMQYRDVYTDFGADDVDPSVTAETMMSEKLAGQHPNGNVPLPDLSELSMYSCLAELKSRLKWLREDLIVQP